MNNIILYLHGALSSPASWNYIKSRLALSYPHKSYSFEYDIREEHAEDIDKRLLEWAKDHVHGDDKKRVLLVGHSFGGVLAVNLARELGGWLKTERNAQVEVIALSPPFAGSQLATILRFLKPNSRFFKNISAYDSYIRNFKQQDLTHKTYVFVTTAGGADWINTENDGVVTVDSMKHFEHDPKVKLIHAPVNHFEILLYQPVAQLISQRLQAKR